MGTQRTRLDAIEKKLLKATPYQFDALRVHEIGLKDLVWLFKTITAIEAYENGDPFDDPPEPNLGELAEFAREIESETIKIKWSELK